MISQMKDEDVILPQKASSKKPGEDFASQPGDLLESLSSAKALSPTKAPKTAAETSSEKIAEVIKEDEKLKSSLPGEEPLPSGSSAEPGVSPPAEEPLLEEPRPPQETPLPEEASEPETTFPPTPTLEEEKEVEEGGEPSSETMVEGEQLSSEESVKTASVFAKKPFGKRLLPILAGGVIILVGFLGFRFLGPKLKDLIFKPKEMTLTYWGLWEPESVMQSLIEEFQKESPQIKIQYLKQSPKDYRERLQSALARGEGPDIFRIHNTWVPMLKNELSPLPEKMMSAAEFETIFYPVASEILRWQDKIYALPLEYDGLALFINEEIFAAAGETPPKNWIELRELASKLTVYDEEGRIEIGGVALGGVSNVDHFSDILGLMILQNGGSLGQPTTELTASTVEYYTLFSRVDKVWDENLPPSTYAFATGKLAMYFGPSWRVFNIQEINPDLKFTIVTVPQLSEEKVNWASFWAEAVSADSENQEAAWQFLQFLTKKENLQKLYEGQAKLRLFGEPYSRVDMANLLKSDPVVFPFLEGATKAKSWYLCSRTFDNGINDRIIKYYEDAVNKVLQGESASSALTTASQGISQVLSQYGVR